MSSLIQAATFEATSRVALRGLKGDVDVPLVACGAWSWGDKSWGYKEAEHLPGIREVWKELGDKDVCFIDTAEVYGLGESERIIGRLLKDMRTEDRAKIHIATKWLPVPILPHRLWPGGIVAACRSSLARLGVDSVALYQVHAPWTMLYSIPTIAKGLAECVNLGLCQTVGVSNYSLEKMIEMHDALAKEGVPLASNQIEFSLLRRLPELTGLVKAAHERNIVPLAYSPIAMGRLSGKYSASNPPPANRKFGAYPIEEIEPLLEVMRGIAKAHDVPMTAVALNYVLSKGIVPLCGARDGKQAGQNLRCLGWKLSAEEIAQLEVHAKDGKTSMWQHG